jgi:prephenate dehydratase
MSNPPGGTPVMTLPAYDYSQPGRILPFAGALPVTFGIQGGEGSFNEEALRYYIAQAGVENYAVNYLYTSPKVMEAVCEGRIDRGQCAIYNSTGGYVDETVNALKRYPVQVVEQFAIQIAHALMIRPGAELAKITTIMCHPQVIAQCRNTLSQKYVHLQYRPGEGDLVDNAAVAKALGDHRLPSHVAVMGSRALADLYRLSVVEDNLQDLQENYTFFLHVVRAG